VPRFDELAAQPQRAAELTPEAARALLPLCAEELARLAALRDVLLIAASANRTAHRDTGDRLLDANAVAAKIGKSRSWVEKNPDELPARRRVGGEAHWSEREVDAWIRTRPRWDEG
jgi:predicted DNA-binding transcriptional regulator AlpA